MAMYDHLNYKSIWYNDSKVNGLLSSGLYQFIKNKQHDICLATFKINSMTSVWLLLK